MGRENARKVGNFPSSFADIISLRTLLGDYDCSFLNLFFFQFALLSLIHSRCCYNVSFVNVN